VLHMLDVGGNVSNPCYCSKYCAKVGDVEIKISTFWYAQVRRLEQREPSGQMEQMRINVNEKHWQKCRHQ